MESHGNRTVFFAFGILIAIILIGVVGFMHIEGYNFIEAFYMTIITISTVGFGEVRPLSYEGMWFTIILIIFSLGFLAFAVSLFTKHFSDKLFSIYNVKKKMGKQILKTKNHVIVVGYGRNGSQAVDEMLRNDIPVVVIENRPKVILYMQENPKIIYIEGDATDDNVLHRAGVENAKALISALASDADNLFVVLTAREINPELIIISRASAIANDKKLKLAGATNVIMPDKVGGQKMAKLVMQPDINEFVDNIMLQRVGDVSLFEMSCSGIGPNTNKTVGELQIREKTGVNILGIKQENGEYMLNPSRDTVLKQGVMLFVLGTEEQVEQLKRILKY
ncbi:MAG: potassium channel protein [Salinivirgaceae bacterium]|jgi:voltage-gated potassium channel|nr:potassium channel protein [Salinivirgaceae bacterium]